MKSRLEGLIDFTKTKFGLDHYYLERYSFYRNVNIFKNTVYTLCMEWFPNHVTEQEDDDSNPEGAAVIEMNVDTRKFESVIFVMGKTFAKDGVSFSSLNASEIIKWIELETGLTYGMQFQLHKEEEGELHFMECMDGVAVSPSGFIDVHFDQDGNLTMFSVHGQFPSKEMIKEETYALTLEMVEYLAKEQLKLVEFPSNEQETLSPIYGVEEIYVTNNQMLTIPYEVFVDERSYLEIDKILYWDESFNIETIKPFERKEIRLIEDITAEQAFLCEASPDSFPITKIEQDKCVMAVKDFLRQEYPYDTGKWIVKTFHRDKGYIHATLKLDKQDSRVFQRKMNVMIDATSLQAINYMDNKPMLEMFDQFAAPDKVTITKDEAFGKIKELFELKPYYVYDFEQKQYVLCGKLDCQYGVNAVNGEVVSLDDL